MRQKLLDHLTAKSTATISATNAGSEWQFSRVFMHPLGQMTYCPCGQPIKKLCEVRNRISNARAVLGCVCMDHVLNSNMIDVIEDVGPLAKQQNRTLKSETIIHYWLVEPVISEADVKFYTNIRGKRKLSIKQNNWKIDINNRVYRRLCGLLSGHEISVFKELTDGIQYSDATFQTYDLETRFEIIDLIDTYKKGL